MTVTAITKRKRGELFDVFVDGEKSFSAFKDILLQFDIYEKSEISDKTMKKAKSAQADLSAKSRAFDMLSRRDYTTSEIISKLRQKGVSKTTAEKTAEYLIDKGFIDNEKTALRYCEYLFNVKNYGFSRVKSALYVKGIKGELADRVIEQAQGNPEEHILNLLKTKFKNMDLSDKENAKKAAAKLMRLGFQFQNIKSALDGYIELEGEDDYDL